MTNPIDRLQARYIGLYRIQVEHIDLVWDISPVELKAIGRDQSVIARGSNILDVIGELGSKFPVVFREWHGVKDPLIPKK